MLALEKKCLIFVIKKNFINRYILFWRNCKVNITTDLLSTTSSVPNQKNVFESLERRFTVVNTLSDFDSEKRMHYLAVNGFKNIEILMYPILLGQI